MAKIAKKINETEAQDSIVPPATSSSLPFGGGDASKSRFQMIAAMINQAASSPDTHLTKFYDAMMKYHDEAGHGLGVGDNSSSNKASISAKPSDATNEALKAEINQMFGEQEGLSEEFKEKAKVIFETAIEARINLVKEEIVDEYNTLLDEEVTKINEQLVEHVGSYLDYVAKNWLQENEVAIESSLRNEITSEFIEGLRNLFNEHNFNIPEDEVEVVDTLAEKVQELEALLNDAILDNAELRKFKDEVEKQGIVSKVAEGLTLTQAEKLQQLSESIEADDLEGFKKKVEIIKSSQLVKTAPKKTNLNEQLEEVDPENNPDLNTKEVSPEMKKYVAAINRTIRG